MDTVLSGNANRRKRGTTNVYTTVRLTKGNKNGIIGRSFETS
jgi:hypothetical protein